MKKFLALFLFALTAAAASAQSAEKITQIIDSGEITYEQSAWLACSYAQLIQDDADYGQAMSAAVEKGWVSSGAVAQNPIDLKDICGLFAKATGLKGGLFYRLTKANRYAYKEIKAMGVLDAAADPSMRVNGQNAVAILNACIKKTGGSK